MDCDTLVVYDNAFWDNLNTETKNFIPIKLDLQGEKCGYFFRGTLY